jgi:hypothetical protein
MRPVWVLLLVGGVAMAAPNKLVKRPGWMPFLKKSATAASYVVPTAAGVAMGGSALWAAAPLAMGLNQAAKVIAPKLHDRVANWTSRLFMSKKRRGQYSRIQARFDKLQARVATLPASEQHEVQANLDNIAVSLQKMRNPLRFSQLHKDASVQLHILDRQLRQHYEK